MTILPYSEDVARTWGRISAAAIQRGRARPANDTWIAACALTYDLPLATLNGKDFRDFAEHDGLGYFAVSERAHGELLDGLDGPGMRAALPGLLAALDALRDIDMTGTQGYGIWAPGGTGPAPSWAQALLAISEETRRVPGWRAALAASPVGMGPFDQGYARLRELAEGLADERHVIHGDLVNRNVLVQDSQISAVIDWGNALYGDWLYDAAWLIYWWPWFPQWQDIDITAELDRHWEQQGGLPPGLHHRLRACLLHIGLDAMAYNAYRGPGRWDDLARNASQVSALI